MGVSSGLKQVGVSSGNRTSGELAQGTEQVGELAQETE